MTLLCDVFLAGWLLPHRLWPVEYTLQKQPYVLPDYPRAWKQRSTCSSGRACHPQASCACPSAAPSYAERPIPATPAVGPLSSVDLRVNRVDAAAVAALPCSCSDCTCLPDQQRPCTLVVGPLFKSTAFTLRQINAYCWAPHLQVHSNDAAADKRLLLGTSPASPQQ